MLQPPDIANPSTYGAPTDPIAPLRIALRNHYEIEREIGQGAFATVYLARDLKHERKVAIKVLNADPTSEMGELRFIREIRLLARLQHPNILPLHDSGHVEALLYYVMPYVGGETLRDRIDRDRQLPIDIACTFTREIADALTYAHSQGIIHRDIKPENVLLSAGHPVLADFGIARVIDVAGVRQLTRTGMGSPGTPAYMSPEQLMGDKELDSRSDTYSLGCVLFEMLTGKPPFAGKDGFVKRFTEPPPLPSKFRRGVPKSLDDVVERSLARNPRDRFPTAAEFLSALSSLSYTVPSAQEGSAVSASAPAKVHQPGSHQVNAEVAVATRKPQRSASLSTHGNLPISRPVLVLLTAAAIVVAVALAATLDRSRVLSRIRGGDALDPSRLAVLPFAGDNRHDGSDIASSLYAALARWDGLNLVADEDISGAIQTIGRAPRNTAEASELARRLGAGWFIWGQNRASLNAATIQLFRGSSGQSVRRIVVPRDRTTPDALAPVIVQLFKVPGRPSAADGGDNATTSYPAWMAYGKAHVALAKWNLDAAEHEFRNAITGDPTYAPPRIWLAQLLAWKRKDKANEWGDQVTQGLHLGRSLSQRDLNIALALAALNQGLFSEACRKYKELIAADTLDFVGWYGAGECESQDGAVIRSGSSPSGWRFRSGYYGAALSYMRALKIEPGAHAILPFPRLALLLPAAPTQIRIGRTADRKLFASYPSLSGDTIAFTPYPIAEFSALRPEQLAAKQPALDKASDILLNFAQDWTARAPASAPAFEALADILEARGQLSESGPDGMSAMAAARKAQSLNTVSERSLSLSIRIAWLSFKQGDFAGSRALADSILSSAQVSTPDEAKALIGLAALTGKIGRMSDLARLSGAFTTTDLATPAPARELAATLFAFATLGVCSDSATVLERNLDASIASFVPEAQQKQFESALKSRPLSMLVPCTDGRSALRAESAGDTQLEIQTAYAKHDLAKARRLLAAVAKNARTQRAADLALDYAYQLAWVRAAIGDTVDAINQLDRVLGAIPTMSRLSLGEPGAAAAAGRAMALRAELAASRGDTETAARWARATSVLWATADPPLQPLVNRMRVLSHIERH